MRSKCKAGDLKLCIFTNLNFSTFRRIKWRILHVCFGWISKEHYHANVVNTVCHDTRVNLLYLHNKISTGRKNGFLIIANLTCSCSKDHICSQFYTFAQKQTLYLHHIWSWSKHGEGSICTMFAHRRGSSLTDPPDHNLFILMIRPPRAMIFWVTSHRTLFWVHFSIPCTQLHLQILLGSIIMIFTSTRTDADSHLYVAFDPKYAWGIDTAKCTYVRSSLVSWRYTHRYSVMDCCWVRTKPNLP